MAKITKRQKEIRGLVNTTEKYDILAALDLLQNKLPKAKFVESIDISVNLGIDPKKSDQVVRGACVLPHGTGKTIRVAVFAQGDKAAQATAAGADIVGFKDLADAIKEGNMDFDVLIATPDAMAEVGKLGQILGPKGLMPNPKIGTVTPDVSNAVKQAKAGQVRFRADKAGIVQASCGKINFTPEQLKENIETLVVALRRLKPATAKGVYIKKITVSTTMGAGLVLNHGSLVA